MSIRVTNKQIPIWSPAKKLWFLFVFLFVMLFMLTLSFPHPHVPDLPGMIAPVFVKIVKWVGDDILKKHQPYTAQLISDSTGLYIHLLVLAVMALLGAVVWKRADNKRPGYRVLSYWFRVIISYYLAFYLLVYGLNKVFKWQFFQPEPNTLFTTLGNTYRDLLYWSTMGTSHSYSMFLGLLEVLAALLLLFRKTRLLGSVLASGIMLNVVMVNFSFDINVKIYSCFLLLLCLLIAAPDARRLYGFFILGRSDEAKTWQPVIKSAANRNAYFILKTMVIAFMCWSALTMYLRNGNFNDDKASRPFFHGGYDIPVFIRNSDTLLPLTTDTYRWKRLFIHRRGYLIIQNMNDEMQDYLFNADTLTRTWRIRQEGGRDSALLNYEPITDSTFLLHGLIGKDSLSMLLKKIDLKKLPVLQKEFNWTID